MRKSRWALTRLRQELDDAGGRGACGRIGDGTPGPVQRPPRDGILLRYRAELLAAGVEHLPIDADALLAAAGIGEADRALYHIDVGGRSVGKLNAAGIKPLLERRGQRPRAVAGGTRNRC